MAYVGALRTCESIFQEKIKEKDELLCLLESKIIKLNQVIEKQSKNIRRLRNHLNYYTNKSNSEAEKRKKESMPLDLAVVKAVDDLLSSQQRYKVMKAQNIGLAVAKGVFHPNFAGGVALHAQIKEAKSWLRKNVFSPIEILKQMDLRGGTLNYEGIGVLNDVESASYGWR